jgi:hypothetical protein
MGSTARAIEGVDAGDRTMVVLSSITFPAEELRKITAICYYEERLLCTLLELVDPGLDIVYVTALPVAPEIVDYYLSFLADPEGARRRLSLVSAGDPEPRALSEKLLERPEMIDEICGVIRDRERAFVLPFNVTELEHRVAARLGISVYGPRPEHAALGSKSGSRKIARRAGVPVLPGAENLFSLDAVDRALRVLHTDKRDGHSAVVKLNNGFSGQGNAILDLANLDRPLDRSPTIFCAEEESWDTYRRKIEAEGAIVEQLVRHPGATSPSVQLRIAPDGSIEIVSTHDQILGGPDGQVYLGCRFPARAEYRVEIQQHARRVAEILASEGVIGSFGIDFVVVPGDGGLEIYLSEINLRMGGTTHPFLMAAGVTRGVYEESSGDLLVDGRPIHYVASDNIKSHRYVGLTPGVVLDALDSSGPTFDPHTKKGTTLHLLGALEGFGKLGALCIAETAEDADRMYSEVEALVDDVAKTVRD